MSYMTIVFLCLVFFVAGWLTGLVSANILARKKPKDIKKSKKEE